MAKVEKTKKDKKDKPALKTREDFIARVSEIKSLDDYTPLTAATAAFAVGVATVDQGRIINVRFQAINIGASVEENGGSAAIFFGASDKVLEGDSSRIIGIKKAVKQNALCWFDSFVGDGDPHPNIDSLTWVYNSTQVDIGYGRYRAGVVAWVPDITKAATNTVNAWLLGTMESRRMILPNSFDMDGFFGFFPNVAWTSKGPFLHEGDNAQERLQSVIDHESMLGSDLQVYGVDKFPAMASYVAPAKDVRIADASRVRWGAYVSPGTTVMHEGFINVNAGTLGKSMVEGRISQGVVVGEGSDIGGGASIMGTLSGGGTHRVKIGRDALLGANSGLGISLGDESIVEAGLYVTEGIKVKIDLTNPNWSMFPDTERFLTVLYEQSVPAGEGSDVFWVKAEELSEVPRLLFRRNSRNGEVEVLPALKKNELNDALHGAPATSA